MKKPTKLLIVFIFALMLTLSFAACVIPDANRPAREVSVTFVSDNVTYKKIVIGSSATMPDDPEKSGFAFGGWFLDNGAFLKPFTGLSGLSSSVTVYAKWTDITDEQGTPEGNPDNPVNPTEKPAEPPTDEYAGLCFAPMNGGAAYEVSADKFTAPKQTDLVIPAFYKGLPVLKIANEGFSSRALKNVTVQRGIAEIGENAFSDCRMLSSVSIPDSVTSVGADAFSGTEIWEKTPEESVVYAGQWAIGFKGSWVGQVALKPDTTGIGDWAFQNDKRMVARSYPYDNPGWVFKDIGLQSIWIPDSVRHIGKCAFSGCESLMEIGLPASLESIGDYAFSGCTWLRAVTIPAKTAYIGEWAFSACIALTKVEFSGNGALKEIGYAAFYECIRLPSITIPDGTEVIGGAAFRLCRSLSQVTLPDSLTEIAHAAFQECRLLYELTIPSSVASVGDSVFADAGILARAPNNGVVYVGRWAVACKGLVSGSVSLKPDTVGIADGTFAFRSQITGITVPSGVKRIGYATFVNCINLAEVILPNGVTSIGYHAFSGCSRLESIELGTGLTEIGEYAFFGCERLPEIAFPYTLTSIGAYAFAGCGITRISMPGSVSFIGESAFGFCRFLTHIDYYGSQSQWDALNGKMLYDAYSQEYRSFIGIPDGLRAHCLGEPLLDLLDF